MRTRLARMFLGVITLIVLYYSYVIIKPYLIDIFLAFVLFITARPLYRALTKVFFRKKIIASVATCLILALFIIIPLLTLAGIIANQALEFSEFIREGLKTGQLWQWVDVKTNWLKTYFQTLRLPLPPEQIKLENMVQTVLSRGSEFIYTNTINLVKGFTYLVMDIVIILFVTFFMFLQGDKFIREVKKLSPLDAAHNDEILGEMESVIKATMWSTVVVALIEGMLGGIGFYMAGIPQAAFWGTVMIPASVIPVVGASLIWIPGVIYLFLNGLIFKGIALTIYFVIIVGSVDNVLRPVLTKGTRYIPTVFMFFAILGGISYFGIVGFILGPLILSFLLSLLHIYQSTILAPVPAPLATEPEKEDPPPQPAMGHND
ncbi:MAG: AI-2E family transporter [Deltaproteobacteria bacterium]|nr:AI-2E family transporter [Deltaproteobacteria bacterium]